MGMGAALTPHTQTHTNTHTHTHTHTRYTHMHVGSHACAGPQSPG
jgi:hypothetical protein